MNRHALKLPFDLDRTPDWTCPTCSKGLLRVVKDSFKKEERLHSRDHSHEAWEPDWIEYVYSCLLSCNNEDCREVVSSVGTGRVDYFEYIDGERDEWYQTYEDFFRPKFFEPHLKLFDIPSECPDSVMKPLNESFRLFFSSPSAASNSVRVAIEELLTEIGVKRYINRSGQRRIVTLHQRINLLPVKYEPLKGFLTAVKWLGNAGSHNADVITHDDVMDAYEMTEHVLAEIYAPKAKKLEALAKKVNKNKGPKK